ncbi:NAD(P)H-binding protein [Telluribacter sp. SYSU D00476]|uniref:NAD(P)H-binding protein n=1 Tax=Telluribacter sp. SYSU D00476 TaxID=2811430 RepID=UPI001FF237FF|nr:NAD(P)H-binding protein [Telluribacter sp. SYSU D00476]
MHNTSSPTVSIIGCGWLGLPLAKHLLTSQEHYKVIGSTTTPSKLELLSAAGITPVLFSLDPEPKGTHYSTLFHSDFIVVDIPPRLAKQGEDFHTQQVKHLVELIKNSEVKQIIYISSTSVYPELNREVREEDVLVPEQSPVPSMVEAELIMNGLQSKCDVVILRCGGLMGYDRIPGKYVRGKKNLTTGELPVNYVHRDDVVNVITYLLKNPVKKGVFNVVAPQHPTRKMVYEASCRQFGWELPTFLESESNEPYKSVSGDKLMAQTGYSYLFPDPLSFFYEM